jgi:REP element-mobilizing transposase RayT
MSLPNRKRPARLLPVEQHNRSIIVFLTVCTKDRRHLLANEHAHLGLTGAWGKARTWWVGRYVILPDHLHLFCAPGAWPPPPLTSWVAYWKRLFAQTSGLKGAWQQGFWDTQLRHHESYAAKWDYVKSNPVRHGLVSKAEDWPYAGELETLDWHD